MKHQREHDLTEEGWRKLNAESDPWRILAVGSEATAWWIHARSNPHVAAEMVMGTYDLCRRRNANIASLWLRSLVITSLWIDLLTQSFFQSWLGKVAPELLPAKPQDVEDEDPHAQGEDVPAFDILSNDAQAVPTDAQSAAEFSQVCASALNDFRRWEMQDNRLDCNVGGFNVLQALNMSRWQSRHNTGGMSAVFNAAAFGLEFTPNNAARYDNSFLKKVLDGDVAVLAITLGVPPKHE